MSVTTRNTFAAGAGAVALAGLAFLVTRTSTARSGDDSAPGYAGRRSRKGGHAIVGKSVTISKPSRAELYAYWRDFSNLPHFMENLVSVEKGAGGTSRWTIKAPAGNTVTIVSEIADERDGELIAWRSTDESDIATTGQVRFRDAPAGRGTYVELEIAYEPPLGDAGRAVAKLFQREPAIQARRDLRRFKMLMETGEIATSHNRIEEAA